MGNKERQARQGEGKLRDPKNITFLQKILSNYVDEYGLKTVLDWYEEIAPMLGLSKHSATKKAEQQLIKRLAEYWNLLQYGTKRLEAEPQPQLNTLMLADAIKSYLNANLSKSVAPIEGEKERELLLLLKNNTLYTLLRTHIEHYNQHIEALLSKYKSIGNPPTYCVVREFKDAGKEFILEEVKPESIRKLISAYLNICLGRGSDRETYTDMTTPDLKRHGKPRSEIYAVSMKWASATRAQKNLFLKRVFKEPFITHELDAFGLEDAKNFLINVLSKSNKNYLTDKLKQMAEKELIELASNDNSLNIHIPLWTFEYNHDTNSISQISAFQNSSIFRRVHYMRALAKAIDIFKGTPTLHPATGEITERRISRGPIMSSNDHIYDRNNFFESEDGSGWIFTKKGRLCRPKALQRGEHILFGNIIIDNIDTNLIPELMRAGSILMHIYDAETPLDRVTVISGHLEDMRTIAQYPALRKIIGFARIGNKKGDITVEMPLLELVEGKLVIGPSKATKFIAPKLKEWEHLTLPAHFVEKKPDGSIIVTADKQHFDCPAIKENPHAVHWI